MKTTLKKDERSIIETRLHWIVLAKAFLNAAVRIFVLGYLYAKSEDIFGNQINETLPVVGSIIVLGILTFRVMTWWNNLWIVTNLRVIDEHGVFTRNSKESPIDKINNVDYSQSFLGRILGYGNVKIQTAAELGSTKKLKLSNPTHLRDTISQLSDDYKQEQIDKQAKALGNAVNGMSNGDLSSELEKLHNLKTKGIITENEFNQKKAQLLS